MPEQVTPAVHPRSAWFRGLGFGLFIHYGLYSVLGHGEWALHDERIPLAAYDRLAERFTAERYDPAAWVRLAQQAGMRYLVLTSRHCDGFCLFRTATDPRNALQLGPRRDLIAEYVQACRRAGMGVGFYYSLTNWYEQFRQFGAYTTYLGESPLKRPALRARWLPLIETVHAQVRELLTQYGPLDMLWFDAAFTQDPADWRLAELMQMARILQPNCLINNRGTDQGSQGDFDTPEQEIVPSAAGRPWETCMTIADRWGYHRGDTNHKSTATLLRLLRQTVTNGGNYLLNIGPYPDGTVPEPQAERLRQMGAWLQVNGRAVFGCRRLNAGHAEWGGTVTYDGQTFYAHVDRWEGSEFCLPGLQNRVLSATLLATGQPIRFSQEPPARTLFHGLPEEPPDPYSTVIAMQVDGEPQFVPFLVI